MIFVTVGNTDPFDRLIKAVECWSLGQTTRRDICAQIGSGEFVPTSFPTERFLDPLMFEARFQQADIVISHAGMGTIITALELGKPLLVMPKRASLGEQRNEHQLATVEHVCRNYSIWVAHDEHEFPTVLDQLIETVQSNCHQFQARVDGIASSSLLRFVHDFVHQAETPPKAGKNETALAPLPDLGSTQPSEKIATQQIVGGYYER